MEGILNYFWIKLVSTIPLCFLTITQGTDEIAWGIVYIVILDTILGVWVSFKYKVFSSNCFGRLFTKVSTYAIAMLTMFVLSAVEPVAFGWAFKWMGIFIILTELFSNFEKLSLLGFKTPTKLLARINDEYLGLLKADSKEERKDLAEDIVIERVNKK